MSLSISIGIGIVTGTVVSFFLAWLVMRRALLIDRPNERSSHETPTASGGGLAVAIGTAGAVLVMVFMSGAGVWHDILVLVMFCGLVAALGFFDDHNDLRPPLKFTLITLISLTMAWQLGPVSGFALDTGGVALPFLIGLAGTSLWLFVMINGINFLDGADALATSSMMVACLFLIVLGVDAGVITPVLALVALFAALAGFLPLNWPPARLFLGDTGSLFIGAWYGGAAILYIHNGPPGAIYAVVLVAMPWLSDVLLTMAWRLKKGQKLLAAHKQHLYQLALRQGASHSYVAMSLSLQTLVCGVLAWVFRSSATSELLALSAVAVFALIIHWRIRTVAAVTVQS